MNPLGYKLLEYHLQSFLTSLLWNASIFVYLYHYWIITLEFNNYYQSIWEWLVDSYN